MDADWKTRCFFSGLHQQNCSYPRHAVARPCACRYAQTAERYAVVRKTQSKRSSANLLTRKANRARQ